MSETPTLTTNDLKTRRVEQAADRIMNNPRQHDAFFSYAESQIAITKERLNTWDLDEPVQAFNPDAVPQDNSGYVERPDYSAQPLTHAQEIEKSLFVLDTLGMTRYAYDMSKAVVTMRRLV